MGAKITTVKISKTKDKGLSGVIMASTFRNESGIGITISTRIFISSEITMAPKENNKVVNAVFFDTGLKRNDSKRGYFFRTKKTITGTAKNPCPTNIAK